MEKNAVASLKPMVASWEPVCKLNKNASLNGSSPQCLANMKASRARVVASPQWLTLVQASKAPVSMQAFMAKKTKCKPIKWTANVASL